MKHYPHNTTKLQKLSPRNKSLQASRYFCRFMYLILYSPDPLYILIKCLILLLSSFKICYLVIANSSKIHPTAPSNIYRALTNCPSPQIPTGLYHPISIILPYSSFQSPFPYNLRIAASSFSTGKQLSWPGCQVLSDQQASSSKLLLHEL